MKICFSMINSSDIDIISQKIDVIEQASDFSQLFKTLSNNNMSIDWLHEYQPKTKVQGFWWINDTDNEYYNQIKWLLSSKSTENTSASKIIPLSNEKFKDKHRDSFFCVIKYTHFVSGKDNQATDMLSKLLAENKDATLSLLEEYFINSMSEANMDESLLVKLLSMLNDYEYRDLFPVSQTIALCALNVQSVKVKSTSFNLFGHWGNREALNLLTKYDEPKEPWLKMKYNTLLQSLEVRCYMHVK